MPNFSYTGYIYRITNTINNKQYIGKTFNLKKRITQHFCGHGGTRALDKAIKKYNREVFTVEVILLINSNNKLHLNIVLNAIERFCIKKYNTKKLGYNCTDGGEGLGEGSPSLEVRLLISRTLTGRKLSIEVRTAISKGHLGHSVSEESKRKLRETWLKRPKEERDKINACRVANMLKNRNLTAIKIGLKKRKPILQYSLLGELINEYPSPILAYLSLNIKISGNILACARGKVKTAYGYKWKYKEE